MADLIFLIVISMLELILTYFFFGDSHGSGGLQVRDKQTEGSGGGVEGNPHLARNSIQHKELAGANSCKEDGCAHRGLSAGFR